MRHFSASRLRCSANMLFKYHACIISPAQPLWNCMHMNTSPNRVFNRCMTTTMPEYVEMPMPKLVPTMKRGVLSKWLVKVGQEIQVLR